MCHVITTNFVSMYHHKYVINLKEKVMPTSQSLRLGTGEALGGTASKQFDEIPKTINPNVSTIVNCMNIPHFIYSVLSVKNVYYNLVEKSNTHENKSAMQGVTVVTYFKPSK